MNLLEACELIGDPEPVFVPYSDRVYKGVPNPYKHVVLTVELGPIAVADMCIIFRNGSVTRTRFEKLNVGDILLFPVSMLKILRDAIDMYVTHNEPFPIIEDGFWINGNYVQSSVGVEIADLSFDT
jgi:hypothetical protein